MLEKRLELVFDRVVPEGKCATYIDGINVYALGVLPGERAIVEIFREKKRYAEAKVVEILTPSPHRIAPQESHYMNCAPWQVATYPFQIEMKRSMIERCYENIAYENIALDDFWHSDQHIGYRTKMEYSFTSVDGKLSLSFHHRGEHFRHDPLHEGCILGSEQTNACALEIVDYLNTTQIPHEILRGITIRESKTTSTLLVGILINKPHITKQELEQLSAIPANNLRIIYADPANPVRIVKEVLYERGEDHLTEIIDGLQISYPFNGFFQNNLPGITAAIKQMKTFVYPCETLVELYSGVGTIGLHFCDKVSQVFGVEIVESATIEAMKNAKRNNITNYHAIFSQAERTQQNILQNASIVVLDPPRPGLHKKVIRMLRKTLPERILYLSCNPITQARDYQFLKDIYEIKHISGYDFYPNTVHVESLLVLDRR